MYSVIVIPGRSGELFAPAGPGQEDTGGYEGQAGEEEPGEAAPGLCVQEVEGVVILSVDSHTPGLGDAEEDGGAAHPADDEAAEGADGDGLVCLVAQ